MGLFKREKKIVIYGEDHFNREYIDWIYEDIKRRGIKILFHEMVNIKESEVERGELTVVLNSKEIGYWQERPQVGGLNDPRLNSDIFDFGVAYGLKTLGGFDRPFPKDLGKFKSLSYVLGTREDYMSQIFRRYVLPLGIWHKVAIVVGDDHLREEVKIGDKYFNPLRVELNKHLDNLEIVRLDRPHVKRKR